MPETHASTRAAQVAQGMQPDPDASIFRFMKLPPELRNSIYSYAVQSEGACSLATFQDPAITAVPRQIRNESLPVFFADSVFKTIVDANPPERASVRNNRHRRLEVCQHRAWSGTMGIKRNVMRHIRESGGRATFRHVDFVVCNAAHVRDRRHMKRPREDAVRMKVCRLSLSYVERKLYVAVSGRKVPGWRRYSPKNYEIADVDAAVEDVVAIARQIVERDDSIGFTVQDVQRTAKGFRFSA